MSYHVAKSLDALLAELNKQYPKRSTKTDGAIGDTSHQARKSDHNPDYDSGRNVVRARDYDTTSLTRDQQIAFINALIAVEKTNPVDRMEYIIHWVKGDDYAKIWSRSRGWVAREYKWKELGNSPHDHHVHVSICHTLAAETDTKSWLTKPGAKPVVTAPVVVKPVVVKGTVTKGSTLTTLAKLAAVPVAALVAAFAAVHISPTTVPVGATFECTGQVCRVVTVPSKAPVIPSATPTPSATVKPVITPTTSPSPTAAQTYRCVTACRITVEGR